jgi:hypothetical protein
VKCKHRTGKHLGGSVGDLLEVHSRHLPGETEENHETASQSGDIPAELESGSYRYFRSFGGNCYRFGMGGGGKMLPVTQFG